MCYIGKNHLNFKKTADILRLLYFLKYFIVSNSILHWPNSMSSYSVQLCINSWHKGRHYGFIWHPRFREWLRKVRQILKILSPRFSYSSAKVSSTSLASERERLMVCMSLQLIGHQIKMSLNIFSTNSTSNTNVRSSEFSSPTTKLSAKYFQHLSALYRT
jgi:hypothetical protein